MSNSNQENIELNNLKPGMTVQIVNRTSSAKKYTFKNGEFGEISFTLIVGGECKFIVGTEAPIIIMDDADVVLDEDVPVLIL